MDFFSKLMRNRLDSSMQILLERLTLLVTSYEHSLNKHSFDQVFVRRQLSYLVQQINSFFSYGFPTASLRASQINSQTQAYDFQIYSRLIYLCGL